MGRAASSFVILRRSLFWVWHVLGSYALAVIVLILLLVLTYAGTLAQANASIHDVQRRYFDSYYVVVELPGGIPFVVPGANLLLSLLFVNLLVGGMVRLRRDRRHLGILVIHLGIAWMLGGSLVEYLFAEKGFLPLGEGESADRYYSYTEWEVAVLESMGDGRERAHIIPERRFRNLGPAESTKFSAEGLPFAVRLSGFVPNCEPRLAPRGPVLHAMPMDPERASRNVAGLVATIESGTGLAEESILWGRAGSPPWVFRVGEREYGIVLRKRQYPLPFRVELRQVEAEHHPGTDMASRYASDVTRYDGKIAHEVHISMNSPMRQRGFTFYQSGFQPASGMTGGVAVSTFSVSRNPTDRVPLYSCILIALGLVMHFLSKLLGHVRAESKRRDRRIDAVC
jgi:hypothetical protein